MIPSKIELKPNAKNSLIIYLQTSIKYISSIIRSRIGNMKSLIRRHKNIVFVLLGILFGFSFIGISFFSVQFCDSEKEFVGGPYERITVDDEVFFMKGVVPVYGGPVIV